MGEPEATVPASPQALIAAGMVDVDATIVDALEEDLATNTGESLVVGAGPRLEEGVRSMESLVSTADQPQNPSQSFDMTRMDSESASVAMDTPRLVQEEAPRMGAFSRQERGRKWFLLIPRLLLHRRPWWRAHQPTQVVTTFRAPEVIGWRCSEPGSCNVHADGAQSR